MSEIRENRITGESVIIAPERANRGGDLVSTKKQIPAAPYVANCPFCPGNEALTAEELFVSLTKGRVGFSVPSSTSFPCFLGRVSPVRRAAWDPATRA
jgi:galactose-1-phosphate uridylyltransferase